MDECKPLPPPRAFCSFSTFFSSSAFFCFAALASFQGLTFVHFSAQCKRFL